MSDKVQLTTEVIDLICERFRTGSSIPIIMEEFGWGRNKITKILRDNLGEDYSKYALAIIKSSGKKSSAKLTGRKNPHNEEWNKKISDSLKGREMDETTRNKISISSRTRLERGTITHEKLKLAGQKTVETKRKNGYFKIHSRRHSDWMKENAPMRGKKMSQETRDKMKLAKQLFLERGGIISSPKLTNELKQKRKFSALKMWREGKFDRKNGLWRSKLEISIYDECLKRDSATCHSMRLNSNERTFIYDIFIPSKNLLVEINGDYWHYNPKMFEGTFFDESRNIYAQDIWDIDRIKADHAKQNHSFLVIWEDDIKKLGIKQIITTIFDSRT